MARIRSIKQDFFVNEDLATVSSDARLLAIGLSTIADRCGRLEDRPTRIKALLFPYHNVDVDTLLSELDQDHIGFVQRYSVGGRSYIQITNFEKHQKPHPKEPESSIPECEAVKKNGEPWKKIKSREGQTCTETITDESSARNGLRSGLGDRGSGDLGSLDPVNGSGGSAKAGASAEEESQQGSTQQWTIWSLGVGKLMASGMEEQDARSFLGLQTKNHGAQVMAQAITEMLAREPVDPKAYLVGILRRENGTRGGPVSKSDQNMAAAGRVAARYEQRS